ncbi:ATP-NAD kinase [Rubrobacter tropicus]|uniref:ATP-NAD kinase n=1 Tax=Rubrobacter tropicus TaxID=2653851 RepID=A0A6G8Q694_9ACTN|nr:NAD(+)/NADH kinase [Rubrobacter tropicus]QIN81973.1 ATP-NAD kinase [Rubrobacter tropicus]
MPVTVGVVANPASGRDIRRLVSGASVFDNGEKGNMVYRLMVGLAAVGVERVLMMPAASGLYDSLERTLRAAASGASRSRVTDLELVEMKVRHNASDTVFAVGEMERRGVAAIVVLGGDGTSRIVARHCPVDLPLCPLSTGTNNAFPEMREATVAGIATGLVASGRVGGEALRREKVLRVKLNDEPDRDCALVDVAVNAERFVGARALWRAGDISEIVVTSARPDAVGLSSVAGLLDPTGRDAPHGLHVRLAPPERAETVLHVPLAPGLVVPVGVEGISRVEPGEAVALAPGAGSVALDGEREMELGPRDRVEVELDTNGPLTVDVGAAMREAARRGLLNGAARRSSSTGRGDWGGLPG